MEIRAVEAKRHIILSSLAIGAIDAQSAQRMLTELDRIAEQADSPEVAEQDSEYALARLD